jgi:hypothetical protein
LVIFIQNKGGVVAKNRVFKPVEQAVDGDNVRTLRGPLKGFPNRSMTLQSVFNDGNLDSSVNISNLDPMVQCEAGFRMIDQLCAHLVKTIVPQTPDINNPAYRLLQIGKGQYQKIKQLAEEGIKLVTE